MIVQEKGVWEKRKGKKVCRCGVKSEIIKYSFITLRRHLVHLVSCRHLQMWSVDCRPFTSEKTNTTQVFTDHPHIVNTQ
ncbi:hypothetical protein Hanom_Chr16g01467471 [Helianthus anomalus]